jgi:TATA-binding protein-associated factor Taf7
VELLLELELLPFDEPELDELELDEESEPDEEDDEPDEEGVEDESDDEEPTDSLVLADPLDELAAALLAASRLSLR